MKKQTHVRLNRKAFSIVELLIAAGVMGVLSLGLASMFSLQSRSNRSVAQSSDFNNLQTLLSMALVNSTTCPAMLQNSDGTPVAPPTDLSTLSTTGILINKIVSGTVTLVDTASADSSIHVGTIKLIQSVPGTTSPYTMSLELDGAKVSADAKGTVGGTTLSGHFPLQVAISTASGAPKITQCSTQSLPGSGGSSTSPFGGMPAQNQFTDVEIDDSMVITYMSDLPGFAFTGAGPSSNYVMGKNCPKHFISPTGALMYPCAGTMALANLSLGYLQDQQLTYTGSMAMTSTEGDYFDFCINWSDPTRAYFKRDPSGSSKGYTVMLASGMGSWTSGGNTVSWVVNGQDMKTVPFRVVLSSVSTSGGAQAYAHLVLSNGKYEKTDSTITDCSAFTDFYVGPPLPPGPAPTPPARHRGL